MHAPEPEKVGDLLAAHEEQAKKKDRIKMRDDVNFYLRVFKSTINPVKQSMVKKPSECSEFVERVRSSSAMGAIRFYDSAVASVRKTDE
jgi:hypothetical protein